MFITRKSIFAVLIALFVLAGFGIASAAQIGGLASNAGPALPPTLNNFVSPNGIGDALIYNYYNARGGNATFFTVVNTDSVNGIRARIRLKEAADINPNGLCSTEEARSSFEILDFDICLSANDMWTGFIVDSGNGAMLCSVDDDTLIQVNTDSNSDLNGKPFVTDFPNCVLTKFGAAGLAAGNIKADDTLEGYITIFAERTIAGEPDTCFCTTTGGCTDTNIGAPTNSLFGNTAIISAAPAVSSFTYDATAIGSFAGGDIFDDVTSNKPDFGDGQDTIFGVNYILAKTDLVSVFDLQGTQTEFIVTLPTKEVTREVIDPTTLSCGLGNDIFDDTTVTFTFFDDKEHTQTGGGCNFSPCLPAANDHLPFEVNAVLPRTGNSIMPHGTNPNDIANSIEVLPLLADQMVFDFGWVDINLNKSGDTPAHLNPFPGTGPTATAMGWPSLGLTLLDVTGAGGVFPMQFNVSVQ